MHVADLGGCGSCARLSISQSAQDEVSCPHFFNRSRSSRILLSRPLASTCVAPQYLHSIVIDKQRADLSVLAIDDVLLPVQEPRRDLERQRRLNDLDEALQLVRVELASALVQVDIGFAADDVGIATTDTLDLGQGVHDLATTIDVGVEQSQNVIAVLASASMVISEDSREGTHNCLLGSGATRLCTQRSQQACSE